MEGNIPQRVISIGSNEYYSTRYVMENVISGHSMGAIYGRLKRHGDAPVKINGIHYWSLDQAKLALRSFEDDTSKEKECLSNGFMTMRMIAETLPESVSKEAVYRYLRTSGFEHIAEANVAGQKTFFYDKAAIVACQEHFSNKESKTIEKPNKMVDRSHEDYRRENAILMDRIQDEKDRNNKLEKKIERHNRTINQLKDEIRSRDRSISGYKGMVTALQNKLNTPKNSEKMDEVTTLDQGREKLFTVRDMVNQMNMVDSIAPRSANASVNSFIRKHNIKPVDKEGQSFLYNERAFNQIKEVFDKETIKSKYEKRRTEWDKNQKEILDMVNFAETAKNKLEQQKGQISDLTSQLTKKNTDIAKLESVIESYKNRFGELGAVQNNTKMFTVLKKIFA